MGEPQSDTEAVITGMGIVSPLGSNPDAFWDALMTGKSGIAPLAAHDLGTYPATFGGEVRHLDVKKHITPRKALKVMSREIQLAYIAAGFAMEDAKLEPGAIDPQRFGVVFGSQMLYGLPDELAGIFGSVVARGPFSLHTWGQRFPLDMFPLWMLAFLPNMPACHIAIAQQSWGPNNTIVQGNVSSMLALLEARSLIQRGWTDVVLVGGVGSRLNPTRQVYTSARHLSRNPDPVTACRPFDLHRDGTVLAEACSVVVLENRRHAERRGARILGKILGGGRTFEISTSENYGPTPEAIAQAMRLALGRARVAPNDLRFLVAHGGGLPDSDRHEATAIARVVPQVPVTAPKSLYGDAGPGSGALELATGLLTSQHRRLPATLNYSTPDPDCPIRVHKGEPLALPGSVGMVLAQATTGQAAAVVLAGPE